MFACWWPWTTISNLTEETQILRQVQLFGYTLFWTWHIKKDGPVSRNSHSNLFYCWENSRHILLRIRWMKRSWADTHILHGFMSIFLLHRPIYQCRLRGGKQRKGEECGTQQLSGKYEDKRRIGCEREKVLYIWTGESFSIDTSLPKRNLLKYKRSIVRMEGGHFLSN